jgi:hypothetical protein
VAQQPAVLAVARQDGLRVAAAAHRVAAAQAAQTVPAPLALWLVFSGR